MVIITNHFKDRFFQRQARTKRIRWFAQRAYDYGVELRSFERDQCEFLLEEKEKIYGSIAKVYNGFVYWFVDNRAITIYPLPRKMR